MEVDKKDKEVILGDYGVAQENIVRILRGGPNLDGAQIYLFLIHVNI